MATVYKETSPEIWTAFEHFSDLKKMSKIIHFEDRKFKVVHTLCGINPFGKTYFHCTRNNKLVTCKKCLKALENDKPELGWIEPLENVIKKQTFLDFIQWYRKGLNIYNDMNIDEVVNIYLKQSSNGKD